MKKDKKYENQIKSLIKKYNTVFKFDDGGQLVLNPTDSNMDWNTNNPNAPISPMPDYNSTIQTDPNQSEQMFMDNTNPLAPNSRQKKSNNTYFNGQPPIHGKGPYFQQSFMELNKSINAKNPVQGVSEGLSSALDMGSGILKAVGDVKQNRFVNNWHNEQLNDQLSGSKRDSFTTFKPEDMFGQMKNPLQNAMGGIINSLDIDKMYIYEDGGVIPGGMKNKPPMEDDANSFKVPMAKHEIEGGEVVQTPKGLIQKVSGPSHEEGGVPFDSPDTKVLSDRIKFQFKPGEKSKTFAQQANKYKTNEDIENLNEKYADSISKTSANLNLKFKNNKVDELFQLQEMGKAIGHFPGIDANTQKAALGAFISKYASGGSTNDDTYYGQIKTVPTQDQDINPFPSQDLSGSPLPSPNIDFASLFKNQDSSNNQSFSYDKNFLPITPHDSTEYNGVTPTGIAHHDKNGNPRVSTDYWNTTRDAWQDDANRRGIAIPKTNRGANTDLQEHMYDNKLDTSKGRQDLRNMWAEYGTTNKDKDKYKDFNLSKLSDENLNSLRNNFIDSKIESRYLLPDQQVTNSNNNSGDIVPDQKFNKLGKTQNTQDGRGHFNLFPVPLLNTYQQDPLQTTKLDPHLIQYRPSDIEPAIAEANRGFRATTKSLDSSSTGLANAAQSFGNSWRAKQGVFADNFNRSQQGKMGVDQYNAGELDRVDNENLAERNRFMDLINRGKGVIDTQRRTDEQGAMQNYYNADQYYNSADYIKNTFGAKNTPYNYTPSQISTLLGLSPNYGADTKTKTKRDSDGEVSTETTTQNKYGGKMGKKSILKKKKNKINN